MLFWKFNDYNCYFGRVKKNNNSFKVDLILHKFFFVQILKTTNFTWLFRKARKNSLFTVSYTCTFAIQWTTKYHQDTVLLKAICAWRSGGLLTSPSIVTPISDSPLSQACPSPGHHLYSTHFFRYKSSTSTLTLKNKKKWIKLDFNQNLISKRIFNFNFSLASSFWTNFVS